MTEQDGDSKVVAGFLLHREIGEGGMGVVWSATQQTLDRPAAVKIIRTELAADPAFRDRFLSEARVAASLDHPHVVPVYDAGADDDELFLAMALVEGTNLRELVGQQGTIDPSSAAAVIEQVADGLQAVHDAGLVHRDVKPANILVRGRDGKVMLTDFGLARAVDASKMTRTGMIVGTLDYIAPEQIKGDRLDARSDVYSLGAVFYELLTGEPPYHRENAAAQIHAHVSDPPPTPSKINPSLAPFDAVIATAMAKDPEDRYGSASDLAAAARIAVGGIASTSPRFDSNVAELAGAKTAAYPRTPKKKQGGQEQARNSRDQAATVATSNTSKRRRVPIVYGVAGVAAFAVIGLIIVASGGKSSDPATPSTTARSDELTEQRARTVTVEKTVTQRSSSQSSSASQGSPAQSRSQSSSDDWPEASGYTAILASVGSRSEAESVSARARESGLETGILYSSDYSTLSPGYWVVFTGVFDSQPQAARQAQSARSLGYSDAYSRYVGR